MTNTDKVKAQFNKYYLGLDISLRRSGLCLIDQDAKVQKHIVVPFKEEWDSRKGNAAMAYHDMWVSVLENLPKSPSYVMYEGFSSFRGPDVAVKLGNCRLLVEMAMANLEMDVICLKDLGVKGWQKAVSEYIPEVNEGEFLFAKNAQKRKSFALSKAFGIQVGEDDDLADSFGCALAARELSKRIDNG